jgi:hypothetical protein
MELSPYPLIAFGWIGVAFILLAIHSRGRLQRLAEKAVNIDIAGIFVFLAITIII